MKKNRENDFIMLPKNDLAFKLLFGDERNKDLLIDLLAAIFHQAPSSLSELEYCNTDLLKDAPDDKQGILDVRTKQADGSQINIEIQVYPIETMVHRSLFYWSRMYVTQLGKGQLYDILKPCIAINIVNFAMTELNRPHTTWHITEDHAGDKLSDLFEMHFLELPKIGKEKREDEDRLDGWLRFLAAETKEELAMLAEQDEVYQRAYQQLEVLSMDETTRAQYEAREAWLRDEATRRHEAERRGWQKGLREGEAKGELNAKLNNAVALLDILDDEIIANKLFLPIETVQRLRAGDIEGVKAELLAESGIAVLGDA